MESGIGRQSMNSASHGATRARASSSATISPGGVHHDRGLERSAVRYQHRRARPIMVDGDGPSLVHGHVPVPQVITQPVVVQDGVTAFEHVFGECHRPCARREGGNCP
jgi:hypothetical protein